MWARRVLGVSARAGSDEVRQAFRAAAKRLHPDAGGSAAEFADLRRAYEVLRSGAPPERRADRVGGAGEPGSTFADVAQPSRPGPTRRRVRAHRERTEQPVPDRDLDRVHRSFAEILNRKLGYA